MNTRKYRWPEWAVKQSFQYALFGFLFGLCFPMLGFSLETIVHDLPLTFQGWVQAHQQNHSNLLYLIDTAPFVLCFLSYLIGMREDRLNHFNQDQEKVISLRTAEMNREREYFKALVENSPLAIATLDLEHKIVASNLAFQELFN